uniref:Uncharacterized protein n=1 Tax=Arundo donax TaxID=35708 RepID=A0A0A8Z571_ARUDO
MLCLDLIDPFITRDAFFLHTVVEIHSSIETLFPISHYSCLRFL